MRLEAKTEMCVPYGTEATVQGSQLASIRLMKRSSEIQKQKQKQNF